VDEAVGWAERSAENAIQRDRGIDQRDLVGRRRRRLGQTLGVLKSPSLGKSLQDASRRRQPEVSGGDIAALAADFIGESPQFRPRQERQSNVDCRAVLGTKAARRAAGAALAGRAAAVDDQHISTASGRKVIGGARAHHARTHDHDARVAHVPAYRAGVPPPAIRTAA
jgi:hypothetical protein